MKAVNDVDRHIGQRIRMRRMMQSISQEKLAAALQLTFQQVQKYEKGANRVSGSRLAQIADILEVPVAWFFEGMPGGKSPLKLERDIVQEFLAEPHAIALATAWLAIADARVRLAILTLATHAVPPEAEV